MADLVEEFRKMSRSYIAGAMPTMHHGDICDLFTKGAVEIEKLRKEVKLLKARNTSLVWRLVWVLIIFGASVFGTFWAAFLSQ